MHTRQDGDLTHVCFDAVDGSSSSTGSAIEWSLMGEPRIERMSPIGIYETSGLSGIGSAFEVKPDITPPVVEVRV